MPTTPAQDRVCNDYARKLIKFKARRLSFRDGFDRSERPDIEQDLWLFLLGCAERFDPARASLNTFIARMVDVAAARVIRDRASVRRFPERPSSSLEELFDDAQVELSSPTAAFPEAVDETPDQEAVRNELAEAVSALVRSLPPDLQDFCRALTKQAHLRKAARALGVCPTKAYKLLSQVRDHFERAGLGDSAGGRGRLSDELDK